MANKEKFNVATDRWIAEQFREVAKSYDNRLGMCLSAAMLMFIRAKPHIQADFIRGVFDEQIRSEVSVLTQAIRDGRALQAKEKKSPSRANQ